MNKQESQRNCLDLALEGERLCKVGDCRKAVSLFELAIEVGTTDLGRLGAIYCQLGNAYFYLQEYEKALEFHKHDFNLAKFTHDKGGEAKACGNLGNTYKLLGRFDEAVKCFNRHLDISKQMLDKIGEARALYNLGNVHYVMAKHVGRRQFEDPGQYPIDAQHFLQQAVDFYKANLVISAELGQRAALGRACGNLANAFYLLGNFEEAIVYHKQRLAIAKEFGDKVAERRAHTNLGNTYVFLRKCDLAVEQYKKALSITRELGDAALEAQTCYCLGNIYALLNDHEKAIEHLILHLKIANELNDRVGLGRAYWSLSNAYIAMGDQKRALSCSSQHLSISKEIHDTNGQLVAEHSINILRDQITDDSVFVEESFISEPVRTFDDFHETGASRRHRRPAPTPNIPVEPPSLVETTTEVQMPIETRKKAAPGEDEDNLLDLLSRFQSRRLNDQRCSYRMVEANLARQGVGNGTPVKNPGPGGANVVQPSSLGNGGANNLPRLPGLQNEQVLIDAYRRNTTGSNDDSPLNDDFYNMIMQCQGNRLNDQRTTLQPTPVSVTTPDEDFFGLILRMQSNRLDAQRTSMPKVTKLVHSNSTSTNSSSESKKSRKKAK